MPRDGSGNYSLPAGSVATTGQTATASQHNTPLSDLEQDANAARPVSAGGTGATSAVGARANLGVDSLFAERRTDTENDARYLQQTGGTVTGDLNAEQNVNFTSGGVTQALLRRNPTTDRLELTALDDAGANGRTVVIPNGTEAYDVVSEALLTVGDAQANFRPLGDGQTIQDVSGARQTSISYQNTTGRTIFVWVQGGALGAWSLQASPDNINWEVLSQGGNQEILAHFGPIPNGYYYRFNGPIGFWKELRT